MSSPQTWLLDTCCALNLLASNHFTEILRTPIAGQSCQFMMPDTVRSEAMSLKCGGNGEDAEAREIIDWQVWLDAGIIQPISLQDKEAEVFLSWLQMGIDDGEAACLAIAATRGWGVVTDDIVARKRAGDIPLIATPDLLHNWSRVEAIEAHVLGETLRRIRQCANYGPPRTHPLRQWWLESMSFTH